MFGAMSLTMIAAGRLPDSLARSTNSRLRSENVCARTALATHGQVVRPMNTPSNSDAPRGQVGTDHDEQDQATGSSR